MDDLEPDFRVRVWRYTYKVEGHGGDPILLNSPQESPDERHDTLVLRQINSDAENKVWVQEQASQHFKRHSDAPEGPLMDDAHGVIVRDGQAKTIPKQGERAATHDYKRGDRIWVERSLVPTHNIDNDENRVPVIDLESLRMFELPFDYICFVPQLSKRSESGEHHAAAVGSVLNTFQGKKKTKARIYFRWMAETPDKVLYVWLNKKDKHDLEEMSSYAKIQNMERKRRIFRNQWQALTKRLALLGLLMGDEMVPGAVDRLESSSDSDAGDLDLHWRTGPTASSCCNLDPCPAFNDPDLDLVASYIGGYRWMEHYHVQDDDLEECPRGSGHKGHCVLRDNRTRCAYATDRVPHTCCKLRENPVLPGPEGDPDDVALPLWETTAGDDYFVDATRNVRTRRELEDRDEIPPQLLQVEEEAARQDSMESEDETEEAEETDEEEDDELADDDAMDEGSIEDDPMTDNSVDGDSMRDDSIEDDSLESSSIEENSTFIDDTRNEPTRPRDSPPGPQDGYGDTEMMMTTTTTITNPLEGTQLPLGYTFVHAHTQQDAGPFYQPTYNMFPYVFPQNDPLGLARSFDPTNMFDPLYPYAPQDPPA